MPHRTPPALLDFLSPLTCIPGMGPKRAAAFRESDIDTVGGLLYRFPRRYLDRSNVIPLAAAGDHLDKSCTVRGTVETVRFERGRRSRLRALLSDGTGTIELLWFQGVTYHRQLVKKGVQFTATGKISRFTGLQMVHPVIEKHAGNPDTSPPAVLPLYGLTGAMREAGIGQRFMQKSMQWILKNCQHYPQILPEPVASRHSFPPLADCLRELHFPADLTRLDRFRDRIRFEELYQLALTLHFSRRKFHLPGRSLQAGELLHTFTATLPFTLTRDQDSALKTLLSDIATPQRMHRLLQGDVGSGKTVVAFCTALPSINEGLQVVWMAPTEVLAHQTWKKVASWLEPFGIQPDLLTGTTGRAQVEIRRRCASGEARFIIGTHALLQPGVTFAATGIFIIDEQHRFGARQRLALQEKDTRADFLIMSATPIPQTLAQTLYGDLDIVSIRSLPPGRQPVATHLVPDDRRADMEQFIKKQLEAGNQCYYLVPRIEKEESCNEHAPALRDLATTFETLTGGTFRHASCAFIHGKLDSTAKEEIIEAFTRGTTSLLVATSIIEVGIDVPGATIMVIENSERFGLAQLHQLRGRVGRGGEKSYCFLLTASTDPETRQRLHAFSRENNGFNVAELDLKNRGPGEVTGYRQSGWEDLTVADILRDAELFSEIRKELHQFLSGYLEK